ncbi:hypothetical protein DPMN_141976 [Dreissena polymorpha]|uniref:Uncharacterized protein n=1 Tax=Dreissena polymorpha TaxID=45954 RepID=A0A9D4JIS2_DREPO|nr:hypothetical protein DPMN_141976 [Dreissena polymorpha]
MTANSNTVYSMTKLEREENVTLQIAWLSSAALMPRTFKPGKRAAVSYATVTRLTDSESTSVMPVVLRKVLPKVGNTSIRGSNMHTSKTYDEEYMGDNHFQCFCDDDFYNYSEDEYGEQDDGYTDSDDDCCFDSDDEYSNMKHSRKNKFRNIFFSANWHLNRCCYNKSNEYFRDVDDLYDDRENGYSDKRRYDDYYNRIENEYYSVPDDYYDAVDDALYDVDDDDYEDCDSDHMCVKYITDTTSEDSSFGYPSDYGYDLYSDYEYQYNAVSDSSSDDCEFLRFGFDFDK